jgi:hypothetical protein
MSAPHSGLINLCGRVHAELEAVSLRGDAAEAQSVRDWIHQCLDVVDARCARRATTPGTFPAPSRRAYGWLKVLVTRPGHYEEHLRAVKTLHGLAQEVAPRSLRGRPEVSVELYPIALLFRQRREGRAIRLQVNEAFVGCDLPQLQAIARCARGSPIPGDGSRTLAYARGSTFIGLMRELESAAGPTPAGGRHVRLEELFDHVNCVHFDGSMSRPRLEWTRSRSSRKLGHYADGTDTVAFNRMLDHPKVPRVLLEFVMYHELLHRKLGTRVVNGRHMAHTRTFRQLERRFPGYEAAQEAMRRLNLDRLHPD